MRIVDAVWTPVTNMLIMQCGCGKKFKHRSDRWRVVCPRCGDVKNLGKVRCHSPWPN